MATRLPRAEGETLRRSRSEGDIPASEVRRSGRSGISPSLRHSEPYVRPGDRASSSRTVVFEEINRTESSSAPHRASTSTSRRLWSPPPTLPEDPDMETEAPAVAVEAAAPSQRRLSWYGKILAFFGYGRGASRARRAFVSLLWNLGWGLVQVVVIIIVLTIAHRYRSPTFPNVNEWKACGKPLGIWCCLWVVRVFLACALSYWAFLRDRRNRGSDDIEGSGTNTNGNTNGNVTGTANPRSPRNETPAARAGRQTGQTGAATNSSTDEPSLPHAQLYARLTLFSSLLTLTWFVTAHILEYTSIDTCRHASPHIWWLTFGILCIMYVMVLEVALLGFIVFIVAPILFVFWNIVLICIGRHPLQNPSMIKPEIDKLPKALVERIPLVIYIPPPPDEPSKGPISVPEAVYSYPPQSTPLKKPKRRFAFLRRLKPKSENDAANDAKKAGKTAEKGEPKSWEDLWEPSDYPFVRLEGNRAACAICLMDFEEPKRIAGLRLPVEKQGQVSDEKAEDENGPVQEIPIERPTDEEAEARLYLADAGEGAQPLRLLTCGHVFHQTCLDPWLIDVSGRCPVCQRAVEVPQPSDQRKPTQRRRQSR